MEEQESDDRRRGRGDGGWEVKCTQYGRRVEEGREERKNGEDVRLGDEEEFGWVREIPVAELVSKDCFDLFGFALCDERVEDDDVLALHKTVSEEDAVDVMHVPMGDQRNRRCCESFALTHRSRRDA